MDLACDCDECNVSFESWSSEDEDIDEEMESDASFESTSSEEEDIDEDYEEPDVCPQKKLQLIEAVRKDDVDTFRTLLDSPQLYNIRDVYGDPLFHLAIRNRSETVFNYIISIENYPFDAVNAQGETALMIACTEYSEDPHMLKYFANELIRKGADVHRRYRELRKGDTVLHYALENSYIDVAEHLIKSGANVNSQNAYGDTPLHACCICCHDKESLIAGISLLLFYDADPTIRSVEGHTAFDDCIKLNDMVSGEALEHLFYHLFDDYSDYDIDGDILFQAAEINLPFLPQMLRSVKNVSFNNVPDYNANNLFTMQPECLKIFIGKLYDPIQDLLSTRRQLDLMKTPIFTENFHMLIESGPRWTEWVHNFNTDSLVRTCLDHGESQSFLSEIICFLLSYGAPLSANTFSLIYHEFGYCDLVKILLHMDIELRPFNRVDHIMPSLLHDFSKSMQEDKYIEAMLEKYYTLPETAVRELLPYFVIPKLKDKYNDDAVVFKRVQEQPQIPILFALNVFQRYDAVIVKKVQEQPQIPLLVELSRNVFRKYFVERLEIKNSRQFYTLIRQLPIAAVHKQILTLERTLY